MVITVPVHGQEAAFTITVGEVLTAPVAAESMRFFPSTLKVHQGDVVTFTSASIHNVTLLPPGYDVDSFLETQWKGTTGEWSPFIDDADDGADALKLNPRLIIPTFTDCGGINETPCPYDADTGTGPVSAGASLPSVSDSLDRSFQVTAPVGTTFAAVDLLFPDLRMTVEVVDNSAAASDPAAIETERSQAVEADAETASDLHAANVNKRPKKGKGTKRVWTVKAGLEQDGIALRAFYPSKLTIARKQRVKWVFKGLLWSSASATFPYTRASDIGGSFPELVCDTDGTGTAPDQEPIYTTTPYCDDPLQLEFDVPPEIPSPAGDGSFKRAGDFEHSGIRGAGFAPRNEDYVLKFPKKSPKAGFAYGSLGGLLMQGRVIVK
jgi:hypothetical protein